MYTPLINNLQNPMFNGVPVSLGETASHYASRHIVERIRGNKIVVLCMGASTQGQISTQIEILSKSLVDVQLINCCTGGQDINDWLNVDSAGWNNLEDKLASLNVKFSSVQAILFGADDLLNKDNSFPSAPNSYSAKLISFIQLCKTRFVNLKQVDLMSRLCEYNIVDRKFATPSGYFTGWGNKFTVESCISTGNRISNVWVTDAAAYIWTDGETKRSDGFQFFFSWMKKGGTDVHLDTLKQGDDTVAKYIFDNYKRRYLWFK